MVERGAYLKTFNKMLRDGREFEKETTYEYLLKRDQRMKPFMNRSKKNELIVASMAGHNQKNDPLRLTNGYIINHDARA